MKAKEKGFSVVEILIVIVIVGALGAAGWLVYNRQKDKADNSSPTQASQQEPTETSNDNKKTFDCKGEFSVKYSEPLQASMTTSDPPQCLISNVTTEEMPPVGPLPPEQVGLFFAVEETKQTTSKDYLNSYIEQANKEQDMTLKDREEITLDNGKTATLATVYGGHPGPHDAYFFIYIKDGKAISTNFPLNTNHKDLILGVLKSVQ